MIHCTLHMLCCVHWFLARTRHANTVSVPEVYVASFIVIQINWLILTWQNHYSNQLHVLRIILLLITIIQWWHLLKYYALHHLFLCTQVTDRITAHINQFTGIQADQEQRVASQRLWRQITTKMLLSMEHGGDPLMFVYTLFGVVRSSRFCWTADTSQGHLELKRRIKGRSGT